MPKKPQPLHGALEMTNEAYHAADGISSSMIKTILSGSPLHYYARHVDPDRATPEPSAAMLLGTAIHTAILEFDQWGARYELAPDVNRKTKAGKEEYDAAHALAASKGIRLITAEDHALCMKIRAAVGAHSLASGLLSRGTAERSYFVNDRESGALIKCRPDFITEGGIVLDLKSARDASPSGFGTQAARLGYDVQAGHYTDVLRQLFGQEPEGYAFIVVESEAPHAIGVYYMTPEQIATGREKARRGLDRIVACTAAGAWPDYGTDPLPLQLPKWAGLIED